MSICLLLDQPDLMRPHRTRRVQFGTPGGERLAILNARGARYEGGGDAPDLSLKWIPQGTARYRTEGRSFTLNGDTQLLLNRGQPYAIDMRSPSESFVVFFDSRLANSAWSAHAGRPETFPEVPSVAAMSGVSLRATLSRLRAQAQHPDLSVDALGETALALLTDVSALAFERRAMLRRVPSLRRSTREELLRRVARAETYLVQSQAGATLAAAAAAAALSPFHLIRIFRAVHGETPLAWAGGKRLDAARDSLLLTNDAIEDIARGAGYASRTAFDRAFQRRFRDTPGRLRSGR